jgi:hypothetical protein
MKKEETPAELAAEEICNLVTEYLRKDTEDREKRFRAQFLIGDVLWAIFFAFAFGVLIYGLWGLLRSPAPLQPLPRYGSPQGKISLAERGIFETKITIRYNVLLFR